MNPASQTRPAIDSSPPVANLTLSKRAVILWLFQLVFPTIALAHVVIWIIDPFPLGRFGQVILVLCLLWYGGCFLTLALGGGRRWIAAHPALLIVLNLFLATGFVGAEMACRATPNTEYDPRAPHITQLSPELGWNLIPGSGDIGEHGWRRPSYPREKSPGHFRIVCIGDSTTFGSGCTWKDAWPHQLEELLNHDADWSRSHGVTEVLNLGVLMYGPDQALLTLKNYGLSYSPDLVIFHLCCDDFVDASLDYYWKMNADLKLYKPFFVLKEGRPVLGRERVPGLTDPFGKAIEPAKQVLPHLQLSLFSFLRTQARNLFRSEAPRKRPVPTKPDWPIHDSFRAEYAAARPLVWALIKEMSRLSSEAGARFLLTLSPQHMSEAVDNPPWRVGSFRHEFQEDSRVAGISTIDPVPEYFAEGGNDRFQLTGSVYYMNPEGNAFIARQTFHWLKEKDATAPSGLKR
jgi:hypothetical protein